MQETIWVWVPSMQREFRSKLITSAQQRTISHHIANNDDFEFSKIIIEVLEENIIDDFNKTLRSWTIVDKFFVMVQLRMKSCGAIIKSKTGNIDLTDFIKQTAEFADNVFSYEFENMKIKYACGLPTIQNELESHALRRSKNSENEVILSKIYDESLWGFIRSITIDHNLFIIDDLPLDDRVVLLENLAVSVRQIIKENFINIINESLFVKEFLDVGDYKIDFNLTNSLLILKYIMSYPVEYIREEYHLLLQYNYDADYIDSRPAGERLMFLDLIKKQEESKKSANGDGEETRTLIHG
jgi:hypothetical protein